jgi:acetyl-CoA carboxylase biotin carboxyl carrier protein
MDLKTIQEILRMVSRSDLAEVEIEEKGFKLRIKRTGAAPEVVYAVAPPAAPVAPALPAPAPAAATPAATPVATPATPVVAAPAAPAANLHEVRSPMIGTFYRRANPEADFFVKVGDTVSKGQVLCIIEAMKLFNEIESEVSGKIVKILVEDQNPVEYDQPLFLVELA